MSSTSEVITLRWDRFDSSFRDSFKLLRSNHDFSDVTLVCGDSLVQGHKVVISSCSTFFSSVLRNSPHPHPLIYLGGVESSIMNLILDFMYLGEIQVCYNDIDSLLKTATQLEVKGLGTVDSNPQPPTTVMEKSVQDESCLNKSESISWDSSEPPHKQPRYDKTAENSASEEQQETVAIKSEPKEILDAGLNTENRTIDDDQTDNSNDARKETMENVDLEERNAEINSKIYRSQDAMGKWCFQCAECSYSAVTRECTKNHVEFHHLPPGHYSCSHCDHFSKTRNAFKKHKQKHNSDKKEKVDKSVQRVNFEEEKALDLSKPRQCSPGLTDGRDVGPPDPPNRNEDRSNTEVAELGINKISGTDGKWQFKCTKCGYISKKKLSVQNHIKQYHTPRPPHQCDTDCECFERM